jgi:hypothetical protein
MFAEQRGEGESPIQGQVWAMIDRKKKAKRLIVLFL